MKSFFLIPAGVVGFLGGVAFAAPSREGMSMEKSPLDGVPLHKWENFIAILAVGQKKIRTPRGRLGIFGMNTRQLGDIGLVKNVRKVSVDGEHGVWTGDWTSGLTEDDFLGSMPLQYGAFVNLTKAAAPKVSRHVGVVVDGRKCSLSGLLGVSHAAGTASVESWVRDARIREKFPRTKEVFLKTNGVF